MLSILHLYSYIFVYMYLLWIWSEVTLGPNSYMSLSDSGSQGRSLGVYMLRVPGAPKRDSKKWETVRLWALGLSSDTGEQRHYQSEDLR